MQLPYTCLTQKLSDFAFHFRPLASPLSVGSPTYFDVISSAWSWLDSLHVVVQRSTRAGRQYRRNEARVLVWDPEVQFHHGRCDDT